ncbi:hypothetical protein TrLO_g6859 [Triparma laevis f. longispina]|uniref:Uncharacterized protein n=1 Tax=Triparma laevis f. longispina TaxID=1714387 RepID=A0A9W7C6B8_9STRA|nr:hypothetical protein TrLO_g6859 [Triparma laevis f. longispina]
MDLGKVDFTGMSLFSHKTFHKPITRKAYIQHAPQSTNIHGLKNKYLQETFKEPPNLHMNLDIKDGWLCEVQMLFRDILLIKKELHKFYDVSRADGPFVVAGKLFKSLSNPDDAKRDDDSKYRSMEGSETTQANTSPTNPLLKVVKAKDAEIESLKGENKLKSSELLVAAEKISSQETEIKRLQGLVGVAPPQAVPLVTQVMSPKKRRSLRKSMSEKLRIEKE